LGSRIVAARQVTPIIAGDSFGTAHAPLSDSKML
jgi:hypothetical protein